MTLQRKFYHWRSAPFYRPWTWPILTVGIYLDQRRLATLKRQQSSTSGNTNKRVKHEPREPLARRPFVQGEVIDLTWPLQRRQCFHFLWGFRYPHYRIWFLEVILTGPKLSHLSRRIVLYMTSIINAQLMKYHLFKHVTSNFLNVIQHGSIAFGDRT